MKKELFYNIVNLNGKEFILNKDKPRKVKLVIKDIENYVNNKGFVLSVEPSEKGLSFKLPDNELTKLKYKSLYEYVLKDYNSNVKDRINQDIDCSSLYHEMLSDISDKLDICMTCLDKEKASLK